MSFAPRRRSHTQKIVVPIISTIIDTANHTPIRTSPMLGFISIIQFSINGLIIFWLGKYTGLELLSSFFGKDYFRNNANSKVRIMLMIIEVTMGK